MVDYAKSFIGTKYEWGGNTPEEGMDCSGFIQEVIKADWIYKGDRTAQDLFFYLSDKFLSDQIINIHKFEPGDIVFYGQNLSKITHVSMCIDKYKVIEAGGEGRQSTSKGFVRVRRLESRDDVLCAVRLYSPK